MRTPLSLPSRPRLVLGLLLVAVMTVLAACGSTGPVVVTVTTTPGVGGQVTVPTMSSGQEAGGSASAGGSDSSATSGTPAQSTAASSSAPAALRVSASPAFGSTNVAPDNPVSLTVFFAQLESVTMVGDDGSTIVGTIGEDKRSWTKSERLKYGVTYTMVGTAKATDGSEQQIRGTISTIKPEKTTAAYIQIPDGTTVGIAAPIVVTFAESVKDRAAAEKMLKVTVNEGKKIEGSWGWMQDEDIQGNGVKQSRVHFRPKDYWPAGTKVKVQADLYGVDYGSGWGREDLVRNFSIGPKMVVKADVDSHRLLVIQDDQIVKDFPVSYGVPKSVDDGRTTVSGIHVITDRHETFTMCNPKYGYCGILEHWAVRMNNNGEFIHANVEVEKAGLLGKANVSHGCVNMSMADAKTFYDMVYYGVPVDVQNTGVEMTYADYIWDWTVPYSQWQSFSAL